MMRFRLDVYVHVDDSAILTQILDRLTAIELKETAIMSLEQDLQNNLDAIKTNLVGIAGKFGDLNQKIVDLQAQVAAGTPVSQEQLDALVSESGDLASQTTALATP